jgi:hypothetical protein
MVPPVNGNGASYSGDTADVLSRPTEVPSPVVEGQPVLVAEVDRVHQLAIDVELQLGRRLAQECR